MVSTSTVSGIGMTSQRTRDRLIHRLREEGIDDERVLKALKEVPRHFFIDEAMAHRAYEDTALPIGLGQTISQPYIVARMTSELLGEKKSLGKVLEVGTGSGYQAAVLSHLVKEVYSIERISELSYQARKRFMQLGVKNIVLTQGDGAKGWLDYAPFEGIIVTAAAGEVPEPLIEQLAIGGRLVVPVGRDESQELQVITKKSEGLEVRILEAVRFVPLIEDEF